MKNKPKKGDRCVVIESFYSGKPPKLIETEIISAGLKWIHTKFDRFNKFDAETLYSEWGGYSLFIGTIEEFNEHCKRSEEMKKIRSEIEDFINIADLEQLTEIKTAINKIIMSRK